MKKTKVLVIGGAGFVGRSIVERLDRVNNLDVLTGSRNSSRSGDLKYINLDAESADQLTRVIPGIDVLVNCVTGSAKTIVGSAKAIVQAANSSSSKPMLVHMSSMSVYGAAEGVLDETADVGRDAGWYGNAKLEAEKSFAAYAETGGQCTMFRIGCVIGRSSALWVDRIGRLLRSGRLGDLGSLGDGWSNLVLVDDIAGAVKASIEKSQPGVKVYNLVAPDSPRWNTYFKDFALGIGCTPVRYKTPRAMMLESMLVAPPLKLIERGFTRGWLPRIAIPSIPPFLLRLWSQQIKLDSSKATEELGVTWTSYDDALSESVNYFNNSHESKQRTRRKG